MVNNNEKGQSTVEFILTFVCGVSLIFVIFNSALNHATGYLVHYATFMSSRVYLTHDTHIGIVGSVNSSLTGGADKARETYLQYRLSVFGVPDAGFVVNEVTGPMSSSEYLTVGTSTDFIQKIDVVGQIAGQQKLELVSESFLGKEPTRATCATRVCEAITGNSGSCSATSDFTLYDDGC